nr:glycosyltransferase family 4 protein [Micromonospora sp. DSM 115978]
MNSGSPPRVLHVSHTSDRGGAELALFRLLARDDLPWRATLCTTTAATAGAAGPEGAGGVGGVFAGLDRYGVPVDGGLPALPGGGTRGRDPLLAGRYLAGLAAAARRLRRSPLWRDADLLHANTAAAAIVCALADPGRRRPLVVHLRDLVDADSLGRFGLLAVTRLALRRADAVLANSAATLRSARPWLGADVHRDVAQSPIGLTHTARAPATRPVVRAVGMLGRLQRWKGQHVFLAAFARALADTEVRAHLAGAALFGAAGYAAGLRDQAERLGVADRVTFHGHVDDVAGFLDGLDILVHASIRPEPLGQTVLQGLARGLPVVATDGGGPAEWLRNGENGLLVPAGDPAALGAALRTLVDSPDLRRNLSSAAARTPVQTDAECVRRHAEFFAAVHAAGTATPTGRTRRRSAPATTWRAR